MNKAKILEALNAIQNGESVGLYHDELETLIGVITNISDEAVSSAWATLSAE